MAVLKRDGTPRSPRRTKAQIEAAKGEQVPVTTSQMTEAIRQWLVKTLECGKPDGPYRWVHPFETDSSFAKARKVWWQNGDVRCEWGDWGVVFQPNVHLNTITVRFQGNKRSPRLQELMVRLGNDLPWLKDNLAHEHARVNDPGYIINTPLRGLLPPGSPKAAKRGGAEAVEAVADKLVLGVTPPPKRSRSRKK